MTGNRRLFGLIGKPLDHSFSQRYFTEKFKSLGLEDHLYQLFELSNIEEVEALIAEHPQLVGLNVTLPYKKQVIDFLTDLSPEAQRIGAVNTIKFNPDDLRVGYNTDYHGFYQSLKTWLGSSTPKNALVLGTGGASMAVTCALEDLGMDITPVSRKPSEEVISYQQLKELDLRNFELIVNTTPLGMAPHITTLPDIRYEQIGRDHFLYDLVYNPQVTAFMKQGKQQGAQVKGGLEMLQLQAEKAWDIWTT